jgi:hypothetical protein
MFRLATFRRKRPDFEADFWHQGSHFVSILLPEYFFFDALIEPPGVHASCRASWLPL